ncbi:hypothetical protein DPX16_23461 [Anabarilius grahami]|uniref:Uncharacterized protein n=1 Tax=Anabarilius grahami TaxID=495550 RepID=A0A3N0XWG6_ANAGA|nr:hypothetical protein DPX16_23461 [Anabarilius grahami]
MKDQVHGEEEGLETEAGQMARVERVEQVAMTEQMTTTAVQTGLKTPTAEQMTTPAVQTGLKTLTADQTEQKIPRPEQTEKETTTKEPGT